MNGLTRALAHVAAIAALALASPSTAAEADDKQAQKLEEAALVYRELLSTPDRGVPEALLESCRCIAVLPRVIKGAVVYGGRAGTGVMSCRDSAGSWSPPSFVRMAGGSWGLQMGAESSDLVLFFMNEASARSVVTSSKLTLGGKAGVAAGPFGRTGEASTDLKLSAEIYTYAKSKGLFAGLSLEGARLSADEKANTAFYGEMVSVPRLLFEHRAPKVPGAAVAFLKTLP